MALDARPDALQHLYSGIDPLTVERRTALTSYYRMVTPWMLPYFEETPLVAAFYPQGFGQPATYSASLHADPAESMHAVAVPSQQGLLRYLALESNAVLWEVHRGALEMHSWTPLDRDPVRARFARFILVPTSAASLDLVKIAAFSLRSVLFGKQIDACAGIDPNGMTLWIPFDDGPHYEPLRDWLHEIANAAIARHPDIFTHGREAGRIRIDVGSNVPGRWSGLPYSARGNDALTVLTPVSWTELGAATPATVGESPASDTFGAEVKRIGRQRFAAQARTAFALLAVDVAHGHDHVVDALKQLLADGKAYAAEDLCAAGIAAKLLPTGTKPVYVVNAVRGLIGRQQLRGERPDFVELVDGRFRLNVPIEPFASQHQTGAAIDPALKELCDRLRASAHRKIEPADEDKGNMGAPFERAVADAFAWLGMISNRDGRHAAPDVVITAPLGATAFTVAAECKSFDASAPHVQYVAASEAARFRDQIGAQYAILIGAGFPGDKPLDDELAAHGVALWSVDDLVQILEADADHPVAWPDLVALFASGRASQRIADFVFEHRHGRVERARVSLKYMLEEGLAYQRSLCQSDTQVQKVNAELSIDSLAVLVNQRLERQGDLARAGVDDIRAALSIASSPLIGAVAVSGDAITIVSRWR